MLHILVSSALQVITGQATDRHLLGLKLSAIEAGMQVPELFMDPFFAKMFHFRLSTSQVSSVYPVFCNLI